MPYQAHEGIGVILLLFGVLSAVHLTLGAELLAHAVGVHIFEIFAIVYQ